MISIDIEYDKTRNEYRKLLDVDIPDNITLPTPLPSNEYEWWKWIQYLGGIQFQMSHNMAHNRFSSLNPADSINALTDMSDQLTFWANIVAQKYQLILPQECPAANKSYCAGTVLSDFTQAIIKSITGEDCPDIIPMPPDGFTYWWDWYRMWKPSEQAYKDIYDLSPYWTLWEAEDPDAEQKSDVWLVEATDRLDSALNCVARQKYNSGPLHAPECIETLCNQVVAQIKWEITWPNYCRKCSAAGYRVMDNVNSPDISDPCVCSASLRCPLCGAENVLNEVCEGPCSQCGWDYDKPDMVYPEVNFLAEECACKIRWNAELESSIEDFTDRLSLPTRYIGTDNGGENEFDESLEVPSE